MTVWRLQGVTSAEIVCSVEHVGGTYHVVATRRDTVEYEERLRTLATALQKAQQLRGHLFSVGFTTVA